MQTKINKNFLLTEQGQLADKILRRCVHCGFCNATCPTYQIFSDELDSPRGRIYQIKQLLEGHETSQETMLHLDRCLTCRACETTCPSGVKYAQLLEIGRREINKHVKRPLHQQLIQKLLLTILPYPKRFKALLTLGQFFRPILFDSLKKKIPIKKPLPALPAFSAKRKMLILEGCVQPDLAPEINHASQRLLNAIGIELISFTGCCGALNHHLSDEKNTQQIIKNNIDRLIRFFSTGIEGIVINASGCSAMFKEYAHLVRQDDNYRQKAQLIASKTFDISEIITAEKIKPSLKTVTTKLKIAIHTPCTLQHAQGLPDQIENLFRSCGYALCRIEDKHLCCGSAGTYSITQARLSKKLRMQRLKGLLIDKPDIIVTANIGCLHHLNEGSTIPVQHWTEILAQNIKNT